MAQRGGAAGVHRPILGVLANRARANEGAAFDGNPDLLADLGDRTNIVLMGAGGAIGRNGEILIDDQLAQSGDILDCPRASSGESDIGGVNAQLVHQSEDLKFFLDGRVDDGGRLKSISESLVIEFHRGGSFFTTVDKVPVMDQIPNAVFSLIDKAIIHLGHATPFRH